MKNYKILFVSIVLVIYSSYGYSQNVQDDFEGSGTISSWFGDDCAINANFANPFSTGNNTSATVLRYHDTGGAYANVRFEVSPNFDLMTKNAFSVKIYVPSSGLTGTQPNQISLKLQDGTIAQPWTTQSEIIKPIVLDTWQTVNFNFETDNYINLDPNSLPPLDRSDFNRVVLQVNGEGNMDYVLAYFDDILFYNDESTNEEPIYDELVWFDEFDGSGAIDSNKWHHQIIPIINGVDWANNEQQHYTERPINSYLDNGKLIIKAISEEYTYIPTNSTKNYTSARLNSKFSFTHGKVEVRAKLPSVAGTWPAIWLLGKNINENGAYWETQGFGTTPWPLCGEIDIMEPNISKTQILGTWHWDSNDGFGYQINSSSITVPAIETTNEFHLYSLIWTPNAMKIYYDDILVNAMNTITPFDKDFFILLNLAMGGSLGGTIDPSFNEDVLEIDYVRVYQQSALSENQFTTDDFRLLPNPVKDNFQIITSFYTDNLNFTISDVNGRIIDQGIKYPQGIIATFSAQGFSKGIYFVHVTTNEGDTTVLKFIKK